MNKNQSIYQNKSKKYIIKIVLFNSLFKCNNFFCLHLPADTFYCAARNYVSKNRDEVSVHIGSVVEVLRKSGDGWWLIR